MTNCRDMNGGRSHGIERIEEEDVSCEFCRIVHHESAVGNTNPYVTGDVSAPIETEAFTVFPDAAPLAPCHALVVPQSHVLSFARLSEVGRGAVTDLLAGLTAEVSGPPDHQPYVFEHGSTEADETAGCGITHAHLHFLYLPPDLIDDGPEHFNTYPNLTTALEEFGNDDYYLFGRYDGGIYAIRVEENAELKCSMYLRKWLARQLGRPDLADYRRYQTGERDDMLEEFYRTHERLSDADPITGR